MVADHLKLHTRINYFLTALTIASTVMIMWNIYEQHKFRKMEMELKKLEALKK